MICTEQSRLLVETMGRYVVLVALSTVTNIVTLIIFIVRIIHVSSNGKYGNILYLYGQTNWLIFDVLVNCICVMTQFRFFGTNIYHKFCRICHEKCKSNLNKIATRRQHMSKKKVIKAKSRSDFDHSLS